jgi:HK97 family phage major capsid protein
MNLKALRQRDAELRAAIAKASRDRAAIGNAAVAEKRAMTDDERKAFADAGTHLDGLNAQLAENAELLAAAEAANEAERTWRGDTADADTAAAAQAARNAGVQTGRDLSDDDPKRGFKSHREFLGAVMDFARFGKLEAKLKPLFRATAGSDEQGSYSDPHGGFLQPVAFSPDILSVAAEMDPTANLTRNWPMTAPMVQVAARVDKDHSTSVSGGLRVYRHSETTSIDASRMETEKITLQAFELIGLAHATESQIADSPATFIAMVADGFRDEFAAKLLAEKISGSGAGGQFLGVLNAPCKIEVAKETGQKAATIVKENIDKMEARVWGPDSSDRIVFLANKNTYPQLASLVQVVGTGGNAVPYLTTDAQGRRRLNGRLIFFSEYAKTLGTTGDLMLVNWAEYIEAMYQSAQQAESIHVRFENHERSFKWWVRNCGMPWWRSALTPKNGDTLSPVVTLATRA